MSKENKNPMQDLSHEPLPNVKGTTNIAFHKKKVDVDKTVEMPRIEEKKETQKPQINKSQNDKKKHKKKISMKKMLAMSKWTVFLAVITNALLVFDIWMLTRFASISRSIFLKINIGILVFLGIFDILVCFALSKKKKAWLITMMVVSVLFSSLGSYGAYATIRVNGSVNNLTAKSYNKNVSAALVVYKGNGTISEVAGLDGKTVGYSTGTDTATIGKDYLKDKGVTVTYKEYTGYTALFSALISGEISCAIMPVTYGSLIEGDENLYKYYENTSILASFDKSIKQQGVAASTKDLTSEPFTVLISGENEGLADTIILVSVNPISMDITMTSIARDSYVPITCYNGAKSKINASHAVSEDCLVGTVEDLTGVKVDYTVEFTFASVIEIVDAVGGVDVVNETPFYGQSWNVEDDELEVVPIPNDPSGNLVHMNGQQALGFVRERYAFAEGDFARQKHQQAVIENVIAKVMNSKDPNTYLNILQAAGNNIKTNMSTNDVLNFISYAMQKSNRYYNTGNLVGVFNFISNRITGYSSQVYDNSLGQYLYTYVPYKGAISDAYDLIERHTNMKSTPNNFTGATWNASSAYTPKVYIQESYNEYYEPVVGGPSESDVPKQSFEPTTSVEPTATPTTTPESTNVEPTATPETNTTENTNSNEQPSNEESATNEEVVNNEG